MSSIIYHRADLAEFDIFSQLEENEGAGMPLRYTETYDQIKEARREDNANLSRGIWKSEFKRADWVEIELLCTRALATQSKDLQIFGWLMESWLVMDNLKGASYGLEALSKFCELFWAVLYPKIDLDDNDARLYVLDWIDKTLQDQLLFVEITPALENINLRALTLADWIEAVNFEKIIKRESDNKNLISDAEARGKITLSRFRRGLNVAPKNYLERLSMEATQLLESINKFNHKLEPFFQHQTPFFMATREHTTTLSRIIQATLEQRHLEPIQEIEKNQNKPVIEHLVLNDLETTQSGENNSVKTSEAEIIQQRSDAYRALHELGKFLMEIDPHSPTPYLLELIVSWENKKLIQIVSDITEGKSEAHNMLKLLAGVPTNR